MRLAFAVIVAAALAVFASSSCGPTPCVSEKEACGPGGCNGGTLNMPATCDGGQ